MFIDVLAFFMLRLLNSFLISDTEASVKANNSGTVILFLINIILGWFLYLKIAFFTWCSISFDSSIRYEFCRIFKLFVAFLKKEFNSCDIDWSSETMVSLSSTKVILFEIFLFSEKNG